jgi:hypothetical protein
MLRLQGSKGKGESGKLKGFKHVHHVKSLYFLNKEVLIDYLRTEPGTKSKEPRAKTIKYSFQITAISQITYN